MELLEVRKIVDRTESEINVLLAKMRLELPSLVRYELFIKNRDEFIPDSDPVEKVKIEVKM
jgi:hypothetical protein